MCKRQAGVKLHEEERNLEGYIDEISEDHAKLVLDRLDLLSKLREIARHSKMEERIKLCENNLDTPDWWEPGKHDRELVKAVLKHGLYRSDQFILNDTEFSFYEAEKRYLKELEAHIQRMIKAEHDEKEAELKAQMAAAVAMDIAKKERLAEELKSEVVEEHESIDDKSEEKAEVFEEKLEVEKPAEEEVLEETKDAEVDKEDKEEPPKDEEKEAEKSEETEKESEEKVSEETPMDDSIEKINVDTPEEKEPEEKIELEANKTDTEEEQPMEIDETVEKQVENETQEEPVKECPEKPEEICEQISEEIAEEKESAILEEAQPDKEKVEVESKPEKEEPSEKEENVKEVSDEKPLDEVPQAVKQPVIEPEVIKLEPIPIAEPEITIKPIPETTKQAADLKARYPDLEVFQPLLKLKQLDSYLSKDGTETKSSFKSYSNLLDTTMVVKWFRDFALEKRIGHIVYCIDNNEWPVGKSYSAYTGCLGIDLDAPLYETIKRIIPMETESRRSAASTPDIITITTDKNISQQLTEAAAMRSSALSSQALNQSMAAVAAANNVGRGKGKKRHIAIDVETERAKLHALLNNTASPQGDFKTPTRNTGKNTPDLLTLSQQKSLWDDQETGLNLRNTRSAGSTRGGSATGQPPPAHQHQSSRSSMQNYHNKSTVIPGTSSTLTPIDLSSR